MGAISRDIDKNTRKYDEKYPYRKSGIERLMSDYWSLKETQGIKGDIDSVALIIDLERALDHCSLTPRMRQVLALHYFADLSLTDAAHLIGITPQSVQEANDNALEHLEAYMAYGYDKKIYARNRGEIDGDAPLQQWAMAVGDGSFPIYSRPDGVTEWYAAAVKEPCAIETMKQRVSPVEYVSTTEKRPLNKRQLRYGDKRTTYVEEVYPRTDVTGSQKAVVKLKDDKYGRDFKLERRKLFRISL